MEIKCIQVGELCVNCYIITVNKETCVIDPGGDVERIEEEVKKLGSEVKMIILTHGHFDHIGAVKKLSESTGAKVYIHENDEIMLSDSEKNLNFLSTTVVEYCRADVILHGGETLYIGDKELKIYHTPGHSNGGISISIDNVLFTGDLLFRGSIGRFDYGNLKEELESLSFLVKTFNDDIIVYPGHGESTTIGEEKQYNPYIVRHVK